MELEAKTLASPAAVQAIKKVVLTGGLGKSTLVSNPKVTIPMLQGAASPASPQPGEARPSESDRSSISQDSGNNT